MSVASPIIADWMKEGLKWRYTYQPSTAPFTVPANGRVQVPSAEYTFKASEGTLIHFEVGFMNVTTGGMSMQAEPNLDFGVLNTVANLLFTSPANTPTVLTFLTQTAPGPGIIIYTIHSLKEWPWEGWCKLYVINTGPVVIQCLGYAYTMALLEEKRPPDVDNISRLRAVYDMFPEDKIVRDKLKKRIKNLIVDKYEREDKI